MFTARAWRLSVAVRWILLISVILNCCTTPAPYVQSFGGNHFGFYEIYLCDNTFELNYADSEPIHGDEAILNRRAIEVQEKYNYESHGIIDTAEGHTNNWSFFSRQGRGHQILRHRIRYQGKAPKIPELRPGVNAYVYLTDWRHFNGSAKIISGSYEHPDFLRNNDRISYAFPPYGSNKSYLRINFCRNNKLNVYEITTGSEMFVENGKIHFSKGGAALCPAWPQGLERVHTYLENRNDECEAALIKELE